MKAWDKDNPRPVTPTWKLVLGFLVLVLLLVVGATCWIMGQEKAWEDQADLLQAVEVANTQLAEAREFYARIEPWLWVEDCLRDPVADFKNLDTTRRLLTLACNPDVVIPDPMGVRYE